MNIFFLLILLMPLLGHSEEVKTHLDSFKNFKVKDNLLVVPKEIVYHDNGKLCWKDPSSYSSDAGIVYYPKGKKCWKDPKVYSSSSDGGIIYDSEGNKVWKDPEVYSSSSNGGVIYDSDGKKLWKDPKVYSKSSDGGIIYHSNGKKLWKDPSVYSSSSDGGIIYHSNGTKCWKDPSVYSDGGKCYDSEGKLFKFAEPSKSVVIDLGDNATAEIWSNGLFEVVIDLDDQSYFIRSSDSKFTLLQNIGSSLYLYMPLSSKEGVWLFDQWDNWLKISERT